MTDNGGAMISGGLNPETLIEILPFPVFIFFRAGFFFVLI